MMDIPDQHLSKIAIDLITDLNVSMSKKQHILTIADHITEWPKAFKSPTKVQTLSLAFSLTTAFQFKCCPGKYYLIMEWDVIIIL